MKARPCNLSASLPLLLCAGILVAASGITQASLIDRGGGLIYDTDLNITWLADANYAKTSGYDADGKMDWYAANTWATNLTFYDSVRNQTYDDWRLPITQQPDPSCTIQFIYSFGYNCTGSEMGHLFYSEIGGIEAILYPQSPNSYSQLFSNLQLNVYWSATEYNPDEGIDAWLFDFYAGFLGHTDKSSQRYTWAVRDGDVAAVSSTVTIPAAAWLFGSGLLGLIGMARRKAD